MNFITFWLSKTCQQSFHIAQKFFWLLPILPIHCWYEIQKKEAPKKLRSIQYPPDPTQTSWLLTSAKRVFFFYPSRGACTKEHADHSQGNDLGPKQTCAIHSDKKTPRRLTQTVTRNTIKKDPLALKGTCFGGDPVFRNSGKWRLSPGSSANHVIILVSVSWEGNQF